MPITKEQFKAKLIELGASDAENIATSFYANTYTIAFINNLGADKAAEFITRKDETDTQIITVEEAATFVRVAGAEAAALFVNGLAGSSISASEVVRKVLDQNSNSEDDDLRRELGIGPNLEAAGEFVKVAGGLEAAKFILEFDNYNKGEHDYPVFYFLKFIGTEDSAKFISETGLDTNNKSIAADFMTKFKTEPGPDVKPYENESRLFLKSFDDIKTAGKFVKDAGSVAAHEFVATIISLHLSSEYAYSFVKDAGFELAAKFVKEAAEAAAKFVFTSETKANYNEETFVYDNPERRVSNIIKSIYNLGSNNAPSIKTGTHQINDSTYVVKN